MPSSDDRTLSWEELSRHQFGILLGTPLWWKDLSIRRPRGEGRVLKLRAPLGEDVEVEIHFHTANWQVLYLGGFHQVGGTDQA